MTCKAGQNSRLPHQVFSAEWKRPIGAVAVTPWHKYVQSLLCKYGVDVEAAAHHHHHHVTQSSHSM
jgi:hypothetical protein